MVYQSCKVDENGLLVFPLELQLVECTGSVKRTGPVKCIESVKSVELD